MDTCDVLIAGGGPAGSACAWSLRQRGLDVVVIDKASFPRDKVCAGWITPAVIDELGIDINDYRDGRTLQPITAFRIGLAGGDRAVDVRYGRPVSFGIRRCEFDHYLLRRSGARLRLGSPVTSIRRSGGDWIVNDTVRAPMLIGAGGHLCPVARSLNGAPDRTGVVAAQEGEFAVTGSQAAAFLVAPERPELYFCPDLRGYGWCFRKQDYLNIGFGRVDARDLPAATAAFVTFLKGRRVIPSDASWRWRGHAYLVSGSSDRTTVADAVLLAGDAAGLAYAQSGEGIRPAIESGLIAASVIHQAHGRYSRDRLEPYAAELRRQFCVGRRPSLAAVPGGLIAALARGLLKSPWFVRHVVLDRWFLHAHDQSWISWSNRDRASTSISFTDA